MGHADPERNHPPYPLDAASCGTAISESPLSEDFSEQLSILETYRQDDDLPRVIRMIVNGEMAHSTLEARLAREILHAYVCLSSRDSFMVKTNQFEAYASTLPR